jgi:5-(carboxyamino)imidazole ribonucleotide synthase
MPASSSTRSGERPRVAVVGAGQLARMTHAAAIDLDVELRVLAADPAESAASAGAMHVIGDPRSLEDLRVLAAGCDAVTFDHEQIPHEHLRALEDAGLRLRPGPSAKRAAQDKLHARRVLRDLGLPVPEFAEAASLGDVEALAARTGWPVVLKARTGGYDGRGVVMAADRAEAGRVLGSGGEWLAEAMVPIARELSALVARRPSGEAVAYPTACTVQREAMCREIHLPSGAGPGADDRARDLALELAEAIDATGIMAVELFETAGGELLVNELALRPHNSGHWTIEGSVTSQFHNHLRAVLDWPLGVTDLVAPAVATVNVVGPADGSDPRDRVAEALAVPGAQVHLYGKAARPGRKLGHVTVAGEQPDEVRAAARRAAELLQGEELA